MARKRSVSFRPAERVRENRAHTYDPTLQVPDSEIDFSDIPELSDEQLAIMRPIGRPPIGDAPKVAISFRIDPELLSRIRSIAAKRRKGYQTLMHEMLEKAARPRR